MTSKPGLRDYQICEVQLLFQSATICSSRSFRKLPRVSEDVRNQRELIGDRGFLLFLMAPLPLTHFSKEKE